MCTCVRNEISISITLADVACLITLIKRSFSCIQCIVAANVPAWYSNLIYFHCGSSVVSHPMTGSALHVRCAHAVSAFAPHAPLSLLRKCSSQTKCTHRQPHWVARARSGGKRSRSRRRQPDKGGSNRGSGSDDSVEDMDVDLPTSAEEDLTSLFEENVSSRLKRSSAGDSKSRRERRTHTVKKKPPPRFADLGRYLPKNRQETIDFLIRGSWAGIFVLVLLFVSVHLFIVGDWVGK